MFCLPFLLLLFPEMLVLWRKKPKTNHGLPPFVALNVNRDSCLFLSFLITRSRILRQSLVSSSIYILVLLSLARVFLNMSSLGWNKSNGHHLHPFFFLPLISHVMIWVVEMMTRRLKDDEKDITDADKRCRSRMINEQRETLTMETWDRLQPSNIASPVVSETSPWLHFNCPSCRRHTFQVWNQRW